VTAALAESKTAGEYNELLGKHSSPESRAATIMPCLRRSNGFLGIGSKMYIQNSPYFDDFHFNIADAVFNEVQPALAADADAATVRAFLRKNGHFQLENAVKHLSQRKQEVRLCDVMSTDALKTAQVLPNYQGTKVQILFCFYYFTLYTV
jgi:hypothetical protein